MGCDIHWILERKDAAGVWHACSSKTRAFTESCWRQPSYDAWWNSPVYPIGERNYDRFVVLSGVRGYCDAPLMTSGLPEGISCEAMAEIQRWDADGHTHGWASGSSILHSENGTVAAWSGMILQLLESGAAENILATAFRAEDGDIAFADLAGCESGHQRLARMKNSKTLIDWRSDPDAWRMLVFFDN